MAIEIRFSHLRAFGRSAAHGRHALQVEAEQTVAMQRGTAVHALVFSTCEVLPWSGHTRRGKEYDAFAADHPDVEILTSAEFVKARRMADAVQHCKLAEPFLQGICEQTIRFPWMGLQCRATPDVRGNGFLTELKTSVSSDPQRFTWTSLRQHYHAQMRFQQIAAEQELGKGICYVVCIESAEPFPVTVFRFDDRALEIGQKQLVLWAERLKGSLASDQYPAYSQSIVPLIVPEQDELIYGDDHDA